MNNIIIFIHPSEETFGFLSAYSDTQSLYHMCSDVKEAVRFQDMKTAIHKADELRKAGYETQTLIIL